MALIFPNQEDVMSSRVFHRYSKGSFLEKIEPHKRYDFLRQWFKRNSTTIEEKLTEFIIEAGAEDINIENPDVFQVITAPSDFDSVRSYLEDSKVQMLKAELIWNPQTRIVIEDNKKAEQVIKLIDLLEEDDDVQSVHSNFDISENVLTELG